MGSDVHVVVVGGRPSSLDAARSRIEDLEARWSRFRPTSEISRLNASAGTPLRVSGETVELVTHALDGAVVTDGLFDPTVLGDVIRAGYDHSLEPSPDPGAVVDRSLGPGFERIFVDAGSSTVTLPRGVGFDPGGIGKGLAADLVAEELMTEGTAGACVNVGGDLRVEGAGPDGGAWVVAVEDPLAPVPIASVALSSGAVATSARTRRTFGGGRHHLIDPRDGWSARSGLLASTVISGRGWRAEVLAKAAFVAGVRDGLALASRFGAEALLVDDAGHVHATEGFWRVGTGAERARRSEVRVG